VHFIGTQGVGKSTLLRAILFFYNADKQKLGIKPGQKTFDEYYFPYQNSYIIYEVQTNNGTFCVLAFKSQGRVAFRFFNSSYDKKYFIDNEGRAYETWDKTRNIFGKDIGYTKIINSYEEYRDILYGNNQGLSSELKKYSLLESKQYQNIPRTVTNVFLNTNLNAEFVKETIIKSLNEEEIKIDLTTYSQTHLKDFENQLSDIKKWTDKNQNGENIVEKQANKILELYSAYKFLNEKQNTLAFNLGWAFNNAKEQEPRVKEQLDLQEQKQKKVSNKLTDLSNVFDKKKEKINEEIGKYKSKLDEIKEKQVCYSALKIDNILERVAKKDILDLKKKNLTMEREILISKFFGIQQRYDVLLNQLSNQLKEFENNKQTEKNTKDANFLHFKEELDNRYEQICEEIRKQHKEELEVAKSNCKVKEDEITDCKRKRSEIKNKLFYEIEIKSCDNEISDLAAAIKDISNAISQSNEKILNIRKEWDIETKSINEDFKRKIELQSDNIEKLEKEMVAISNKIENSKDSFYGWLDENVVDWNKTIGKVIDEDKVLFQSGLNPQKISDTNLNFYGISIDINDIAKEVKTVDDLKKEKEDLQNKILGFQETIADLRTSQEGSLEKLRKNFHPKIKEQKELIQKNGYNLNQSKTKIEATKVNFEELKIKSTKEKEAELKKIDDAISKLSEEKLKAEENAQKIENDITKLIDTKRKEKERKLKAEHQKLTDIISKIDSKIQNEKNAMEEKTNDIKEKQKNELDREGADTKLISAIDLQLSTLENELLFIEDNRDRVAEYNKDKRELFDKEDEFKSEKISFENQLKIETGKHIQQEDKLIEEIELYKVEVEKIKRILAAFSEDITAFESFKKSTHFQSIETYVDDYNEKHKTENHCINIISELNQTFADKQTRLSSLQQTIINFVSNFQENNIFSFKTKFIDNEYFDFADNIKEFIDENKIDEYKKRFEERFADIIHNIGSEIQRLIEKQGEISKVIWEINNDFIARNFVGAIKSMELRTTESANNIFKLLREIKNFNDENPFDLGSPNLFASKEQINKNEKAISFLKALIKAINDTKEKEIMLSDSFELQFKIIENDNDTGWVEKLTNVGSDGTDILVKAMINIMLLNVFKEKAGKKNKGDFSLHCMMDEIGKLHPNNVKGILQFANERNIRLINSSPTSYNAVDYKYTYLLKKDSKNVTSVKKLVNVKA
jgi:hypothetical protein